MSANAPTLPVLRRALTSDLPWLGRLDAITREFEETVWGPEPVAVKLRGEVWVEPADADGEVFLPQSCSF
jgi:hypothetical protein